MADVNGFDPVAWSIDGGTHRGELLRVLAYVAGGGTEGIVSVGDCKVHQVGGGAQQIAMDAGALLIRNRSANVINQTYVANNRVETRLDTPAATGTARSHLVIVRIKDPQYSPWGSVVGGGDPKTFQYTEPLIIQNVPATTKSAAELNLGYSAYAVARLDIPANTTNVLDSHIVNLRQVANPHTQRVVRGLNNNVLNDFAFADTTFHQWPPNATWSIDIPPWATHLIYSVALGHLIPVYQASATTGYLRLNVGNGQIVGDSVQWEVDSENDTNPQHILNADEYSIPTAIRGTTQNFKLEARRITGVSDLRWHPVSSLALDITFEERAV